MLDENYFFLKSQENKIDKKIDDLVKVKRWIGVTSTPLVEGATTNPVIIGEVDVTAISGDVVTYNELDYAYNGSIWQEVFSALGTLAYKNSASGTYTPQGEVTTLDLVKTEQYKLIDLIDDVGTLPSITYDSVSESLSFSAGTLPTTKTDNILTGITLNPQPQQIIGRESIVTVS